LIFYFVLFSRLPHSLAFEISREKEQILQEDKLNGKREDLAMAGIQLEKKKLAKIVPIILFCVLMDIALHLVTNEYSTMPKNPNYSKLVGLLGTEITVTIWSLLAFSIALLAVPEAQPPQSHETITLNTTTAIRLVLDKAASVEELGWHIADGGSGYKLPTRIQLLLRWNGI
jgi:hypothetical protein